jgi:RNA polymerase sigma-70 factor (ECF subfamily)
VYIYVRAALRGNREEAKDVTQEFFLELVEGLFLDRFSPDKGSFRGYLKGSLRFIMMERNRKAGAQKRGGNCKLLRMDDGDLDLADQLAYAPGVTPEQAFDKQWRNSLYELAIKDLRESLALSGKEKYFQVFELYYLRSQRGEAPLSYTEVANTLGIRELDVSHYLAACRKSMREKLLGRIRAFVSTEQALSEEVAEFFFS